MKKLSALILAFLFFFSAVSFAGIVVYPLVEKISGSPGETVSFTLNLINNFDVQVSLSASATGFLVNGVGSYEYSNYEFSCSKWMTFSQEKLTLGSGQQYNLSVLIHIPQNASGQRFATIMVNYVPPHQTGMVRIQVNTAVIVILDIKNSPHIHTAKFKPIKIYNTKLDKLPKDFPNSLKNYPYVFKLDYTNEGNVVIGLQGQFRVVSDTLHKLVGNINLDRQKTICFPDITRTIWIPFERLMPNGEYRALLSADLGDHHMTSQVFKFKITDASLSQAPALKLNKSEIDIPLERLNTYLGRNFKIESLDYRKINISAQITGFTQTKGGTLASAPLDKEIFGNLRMYPSKFSVYPYSNREARIAGRAPSVMPNAGQYYALLTLTANVANGSEPKIIKVPVIISTGKLTKSLFLNNLTTTQIGTSTKVSIDIRNTGNSYVDYSGQVFITNEEGKSVLIQPVAIKGGRVYAGFTVSPSVVAPVELKKGFTVRVVVKYMTDKGANGSPIYQTISKELIVH